MKEDRPVLVTGATGGRQGSTGRLVAHLLRERGVPVRALVRKLDERADAIRDLGAEIVQGDLLDLASVRAALAGVGRAYFVFPVGDGLIEATAIFAQAARESGVDQVVNLSQLVQRSGEQPTPHQTRHWLGEQIFDRAGVGAVHLDATVFYENLGGLARASLASSDVIALPWGSEDTAIALVAAEDVARVAAGLLTGPPVPGGTVLPLVGSVLEIREIAAAFGAALGRPVQYREIGDDEWAQRASGFITSPAALEHLSHLWRFLRTRPRAEQAAYAVSESIERLGGAPPKRLVDFLREQAQMFARRS